MAITMDTVKVGVGLAGKFLADKGVDIVVKAATQGVESKAQKVAVWVGKATVGKIAGDYVYKECTGRDFNKDAAEFIDKKSKELIKKIDEANKKDKEEKAKPEMA